MLGINKNRRQNRNFEAFTKIHEAILKGELSPNQRLVETELSKKFGMSRTPIREALRELHALGHVSRLSNGRLIVTEYTPKQIHDIFEVKGVLEILVAKNVCRKATEQQLAELREFYGLIDEALEKGELEEFNRLNDQFHDMILEACGNEKLASMCKTIKDVYFEKKMTYIMSPKQLRRLVGKHKALFNAIQERNESKVKKCVKDYFKLVEKRVLTQK
jgi:DNA-binding GntR family transcriptional regulator